MKNNIYNIINKLSKKIEWISLSASEIFRKFWKPDKVYIVPNLFGIIWAGSSLYMYILYFLSSNSPVLVLSVFMTAFWIFDMLYNNTLCKNVHLSLQNTDFTADIESEIHIRFENFQEIQSIEIFSDGYSKEPKVFFFNIENKTADDLQNLTVPIKAPARTHLTQIRFRVSIRSVIGFFICWKYMDVLCDIHIWPRSVLHISSAEFRNLENLSGERKLHGSEEFYEYRNYMEGDSLSRVDWKVFARRNQKFTKIFNAEENVFLLINWKMTHWPLGFEEKLETVRALLEFYITRDRICILKVPVRKEDILIRNHLDLIQVLNLFSEASEEEWES